MTGLTRRFYGDNKYYYSIYFAGTNKSTHSFSCNFNNVMNIHDFELIFSAVILIFSLYTFTKTVLLFRNGES